MTITLTVKTRQKIERHIVSTIIADAIAQGCSVSVWNGETMPIKRSTDRKAILDGMFQTDEEELIIYSRTEPATSPRIGWVALVYGNTGWDVVADNNANAKMEAILANAEKLSDFYADRL